MARVYQPKGREGWYCDYFLGGRRVRKFLSDSKTDAQRKLGALLDQRKAAKAGGVPFDSPWTFWREEFLALSKANKKKATVYRDEAALVLFERFYMPARLSELTPTLLIKWMGHIRDDFKPATVNRHVGALKAMMRVAEDLHYVQPQKWTLVKRLRQARGKLLYWTTEQAAHLLAHCDGVWRTMAQLGLGAGLRREEIYWLAWEDVDFKRRTIHVRAKDYEDRVIPMSGELAEHLEHVERGGRWVLGQERPSPGTMSSYFRRIVRRAQLQGSLHTLRHTFASHAVMNGVPLKVVKEWLGHADIETTMVYAHLIPELSDPMISRLPRYGAVATPVATPEA